MTPRGDIDWIDLSSSPEQLSELLRETRHSLLPAGEGSIDEIVGVVKMSDLLAAQLSGRSLDARTCLVGAPVVHDFADALDVLSVLREAEVPVALVHDEYGHFEGIVTPADILETIAGVFRSDIEEGEFEIVERDDGSWLLPGSMPADEMADHLGILIPERRNYTTLAGFLLAHFEHLPRTGESVDAMGWRFEVVDLDGRRIDKVLANKAPASTGE